MSLRCPQCNPRVCPAKAQMCIKHLLDEVDCIRSNMTLVESAVFDIGFAEGCFAGFFKTFQKKEPR